MTDGPHLLQRRDAIALAIMNAVRIEWGLTPLTDVFQQGVQEAHIFQALRQADAVRAVLGDMGRDDYDLGFKDAQALLPCGHPRTALVSVTSPIPVSQASKPRKVDPSITVCGWCRDREAAYEECAQLASGMKELPKLTSVTTDELLAVLISAIRAKKPR